MISNKKFVQPNDAQRITALGDFSNQQQDKLFFDKLIKIFPPIQKPSPNDWLSSHSEPGQTFDHYRKSKIVNLIRKDNNKHTVIYLQPLEKIFLDKNNAEFLQLLKQYCECFFYGIQVKILDLIDVQKSKDLRQRLSEDSKKKQYDADQILNTIMLKVPSDAYCIVGVMMTDIYLEGTNFVFGLSDRNRGVFSFARYDDNFYNQQVTQITFSKILLQRCFRTLAHEISHMFGIWHCIYFSCLINGSNSLEESISRPCDLCPVCIRKLQFNLKFDFLERYQAMAKFLQSLGSAFEEDLKFFQQILQIQSEYNKQQ